MKLLSFEKINQKVLNVVSELKESNTDIKNVVLLEEISKKYSCIDTNYKEIIKDLTNKLALYTCNENTLSYYICYAIALVHIKKEIINITKQKNSLSDINMLIETLITTEYMQKSTGNFKTFLLNRHKDKILYIIRNHKGLFNSNFNKMPINTLAEYISNKLKIKVDEIIILDLIKKYFSEEFEIISIIKKGKNKKYIVAKSKKTNQISQQNTQNISIRNEVSKNTCKNTINLIPNEKNIYKVIIVNKLRKECLCKHQLEARKVNVLVFDYKKQNYSEYVISSNYCSKCNQYYTTKTELRAYNENNYKLIMNTFFENSNQVKLKNGKITIQEDYYNGRKKESFLHQMGYNVSDSKLTSNSRFNILKYVIDNYDYYAKAKNHIEHLINEKVKIKVGKVQGSVYYKNAIKKWEEDLKRIIIYQTNKNKKNMDTAILKNTKV
ncbi:UNVERIFIED_CONTAM: hypothetical protein Cloal_2184 [Acetivibrio alkalicellulosi]